MLGASIGVLFVVHPVRLQRRLECRPTRIDAFIHSCVVDQHVRLDLCDVGCRRLCAVEGNTGKKAITQPDRQRVHDTASKAEADGAESAVACRMPFDPVCGRHEVFGSLGAIEFSESLDRFFFIARIAADRSQRIRRKCDVVCDSETPCDVPDVGVQATIFMDDQDRGQFALGIRRCHKIAAGFGITLWRRIADVLALDSRIGGRNLLS